MTTPYELCPQHSAPLFRYGSDTYCLHDWLTGLVGQGVVDYVPETASTPLVLVLASRCVLPVQGLWRLDAPELPPPRPADDLYSLRLAAFRLPPDPQNDIFLQWARGGSNAALGAWASTAAVYTEFWTTVFFSLGWPDGCAPADA